MVGQQPVEITLSDGGVSELARPTSRGVSELVRPPSRGQEAHDEHRRRREADPGNSHDEAEGRRDAVARRGRRDADDDVRDVAEGTGLEALLPRAGPVSTTGSLTASRARARRPRIATPDLIVPCPGTPRAGGRPLRRLPVRWRRSR